MQQRKYHVLRKIKANTRPVNHLFIDVESRLVKVSETETEHRLWFGWMVHWKRQPEGQEAGIDYRRFTTVNEFWDLTTDWVSANHPLYLVSHNVNYDFGVLDIFDQLEDRAYTLSNIYLGGMTAILHFTNAKHKIVVLDNSNYFQGTLASLGDALGFPKLDVDPLTATEKEADPYCKRDCAILLRAWQTYYEFLDEHDLGRWGKTLPAQAFNAYRHRFMAHAIHIHADERTLEIERAAYHGGRTSIFYKGKLEKGPYYYLDVNSMYPYVMSAEVFPRRMHTTKDAVSLDQLRNALKKYLCIADVTVRTDEPVYQTEHKGHAIHPVGQFRVTLSTPEIQYALDHGHILDVHTITRYTAGPLFKSYVRFFYGLKAQYKTEDNGSFYLMVKLFLNSLYGKFGQRSSQMVKVEIEDPDIAKCKVIVNAETGKVRRLYRFGSTLWEQEIGGEAFNSAPAIAAHVTAYARMLLWSLMKKAGHHHYYYCDTDSLIVDQVGYENLADQLDDSRLGALKVEHKSDTCTLRAPKCYTFGDTTKRKGVPKKAQQISPNTWAFDSFPSFRTQATWKEKTPFHTTATSRSLTYRIYDGQETPSGWIAPFDAGTIAESPPLSETAIVGLYEIEAQIETLREGVRVDARTVFSAWDYRKGTWRKGRDHAGNIVPFEYSQWDSKATELGFDDVTDFQHAVTQALHTWSQIGTLRQQAREIRSPVLEQVSQEPFPF